MLQINNLTKIIEDKVVLEDINLSVDKGDILAVVGSNGCGKTTLLTCVMNILYPEKGCVEYLGRPHSAETVLSDFYYVQDYIYFPKGKTIAEVMDYEKCFYKDFDEQIVFKMIDEFGFNISDVPSRMSKGQKKIIAFIFALASMTSVLILDELIDGLDIVMKRKIWTYVIDVTMEREATVLVSSHDIRELENICNKYVLMHDGRIIKNNDLELEKEGMKRVQFSLDAKFVELENDSFKVVSFSQYGSVVNAIVDGDFDKFKEVLSREFNLGLYEEFEVSLEDIMLYNLKKEGYTYE